MNALKLMPLCCVFAFVLWSCSGNVTVKLPTPKAHAALNGMQAGIAKTDITPMPRYPMAGWSLPGAIARGFWTRLYARAFYFEDAAGANFALVSCDMWAIPAGLADQVAELVGSGPDAIPLAREQIVLCATHTHSAHGAYMTSEFYNAFPSRFPGFDNDMFQFLAHRIARSIRAAWRARQPARLTLNQSPLAGIARNRSLEPFLLNPESAGILGANAELPCDNIQPGYTAEHCRAVDPTLTTLRIRSLAPPGDLLGVAAFFAVHPNVLGAATEVCSGDVTGVAAILAEHRLQRQYSLARAPIVGVFNGAEGDIAANWAQRDRRNVMRLGALIANGIASLVGVQGHEITGKIDSRFTIANVRKAQFVSADGLQSTADKPLFGAGMLGGSEDGDTPLRPFGFAEGMTGDRKPFQGVKRNPVNLFNLPPSRTFSRIQQFLLGLLIPDGSIPESVPLGVYRLGDIVFVPLPGEFTSVMGRRIRTALNREFGAPTTTVLLGLANEYLSYTATPDEYELQHYEGASTIWGKQYGPLIRHELTRLARSFIPSEPQPPPIDRKVDYDPGPHCAYGVEFPLGIPDRIDEGLSNIVQCLETGLPVRDYPFVYWRDTIPSWDKNAYATHNVTPHVAIEFFDTVDSVWKPYRHNGIAITNDGLQIVTLYIGANGRESKWGAIWMTPSDVDTALQYRFFIRRINGVQSPPAIANIFSDRHDGYITTEKILRK